MGQVAELSTERRGPLSLLSLDFYAKWFSALLPAALIGGLCVLIASAFTGHGGDVIVGDALGYFEYSRSLLIEHRLPVPFVKYPAGVSMVGILLYAPAVWITNALASAGAITATDAVRRGMTLFEQIAFCIPSVLLAYVALLANVGMLTRLGFAERVAKPAVLFFFVATNIGFFVLKEPAMSESATYSFVSLFYWGVVRWLWDPTATRITRRLLVPAMTIGFFLGMAGAVRQQNILHALAVPLILWPQHALPIARRLKELIVIAASSALVFSIPWIVWYLTLGKFQLFMYCSWEHFNWLSPNPWAVLFEWKYHGLFVWHPLFLLAAIGLVPFFRSHRDLMAAWLVPLLIQAYLVAAWYHLSFGASFGGRGMFTIFPLLLCGFAAFVKRATELDRERPLLAGALGLTVLNAALALLFSMQRIDPYGAAPPLTKEQLNAGWTCPAR
jgi:hypothetical protein